MPKISQRAEKMPASPIRKLVPYALQAKQKGVKVYHLNIGQPDIETPQTALEELKHIDLKVLEYSLSEGNIEYRKALETYYHSLGFTDLTTDNFIVTNGGSEALSIALSTLCDDGDEIIIPEPYYANYNGFSNHLSRQVLLCRLWKNLRKKLLQKLELFSSVTQGILRDIFIQEKNCRNWLR